MRTADCVHSLMHFLHMVSFFPPPLLLFICMHSGQSCRLSESLCASDVSFFPRLRYRPAGGRRQDQDGGRSCGGPPGRHRGYRPGVLGLHEESQVSNYFVLRISLS